MKREDVLGEAMKSPRAHSMPDPAVTEAALEHLFRVDELVLAPGDLLDVPIRTRYVRIRTSSIHRPDAGTELRTVGPPSVTNHARKRNKSTPR